ncbi:MAG: HAMP domain-containing protein, partial [Comamonadaceae bacterium]
MFDRLTNLLLGNLRKQLIVGMTLVIIPMMTLFVWSMTSREVAEEIKSHTQQVSALAESVGTSSAVWVASRDYSGLQEIVSGIASYPSLRYVIVLDLRGQVLAHTDPSKVGLYLDLTQQKERTSLYRTANLVEVISRVTLSGAPIGWVRLAIDRSHFSDEVAQIQRDGLAFSLIATLLSILIAVLAGRYLTRRLAAIQQVADAVNAGQATARAVLSGDDEAARLARQFNSMLDSLEQRDKQLRSFYEFDIVGLAITSPEKGWLK